MCGKFVFPFPLSRSARGGGAPRMVHATTRNRSRLARGGLLSLLVRLTVRVSAAPSYVRIPARVTAFFPLIPSSFAPLRYRTRAADRVLPVFAGPLYLLSVTRIPDASVKQHAAWLTPAHRSSNTDGVFFFKKST